MPSTQGSAWPGVAASTRYERCEQCGAAMDQQQRYCVECAARRKDVPNPATTYFASSARKARTAPTPATTPQEASGGRALAVALFALLPIAVALGVLAGRGSSDGTDNQALIDALKQQQAAGGATATGTANASVQALTSDFSLQKGFSVKLEMLPFDGTDQAAAEKAKKSATAKGAKDVGIINPSDFTLTPDQGTDYVLYSGEFKGRGEAEKALRGLKGKFKSAEVIAVKSAASATAGGGKVVANTDHGTIHQVTGFKATPEKTAQDTQTVQGIANATGKSYVDKQKDLPDVIVIGEGGKTSTPAPTGAGD
jgi:hypothetical protein